MTTGPSTQNWGRGKAGYVPVDKKFVYLPNEAAVTACGVRRQTPMQRHWLRRTAAGADTWWARPGAPGGWCAALRGGAWGVWGLTVWRGAGGAGTFSLSMRERGDAWGTGQASARYIEHTPWAGPPSTTHHRAPHLTPPHIKAFPPRPDPHCQRSDRVGPAAASCAVAPFSLTLPLPPPPTSVVPLVGVALRQWRPAAPLWELRGDCNWRWRQRPFSPAPARLPLPPTRVPCSSTGPWRRRRPLPLVAVAPF